MRPIVERDAGRCNGAGAGAGRVRGATAMGPCACAISKDYLHCVLSLEKASNDLHEAPPRDRLSHRRLESETNPDIHREQPPLHSQRQSLRRLVRVRLCAGAAAGRPAACAGARASRVRGSIPSGRQPRLNDALSHSEFQRPGFRKGFRAFSFDLSSFTSGVPLHSDAANLEVCAARDVRGKACLDLVQRDAASDGMARAGAQPK